MALTQDKDTKTFADKMTVISTVNDIFKLTLSNIDFNHIIDNYYPNTFHLLRPNIQNDVRNVIAARYNEFEKLAKNHNITLDELLAKIYYKTGKFPFYLNTFDILQIDF